MALTHPQTDSYDDCLTQACARIADASAASVGFRRLGTAGWTPAAGDEALITAEEAAEKIARDQAAYPENGMAFTDDELRDRGTLSMVTPDPQSPVRFGTLGAQGAPILTAMRVLNYLEWLPTDDEWASGANLLAKMQACAARITGEVHAAIVEAHGPRYLRESVLESPPRLYQLEHDDDAITRRLTAVITHTFGPGSAAAGRR